MKLPSFSKKHMTKAQEIELKTDKKNRKHSFLGRSFSMFFNGLTGYMFMSYYYDEASFDLYSLVNFLRDFKQLSPINEIALINYVGLVGMGIGVLFDSQKALCARNINKAKANNDVFGLRAWSCAFFLLWGASIGSFAYIGIQNSTEKTQEAKIETKFLVEKLAAHETAENLIKQADKKKKDYNTIIENAQGVIQSITASNPVLSAAQRTAIANHNYRINKSTEEKDSIDKEFGVIEQAKKLLTDNQIESIKNQLSELKNTPPVSGFNLPLPYFDSIFVSWLLLTLILIGCMLDGLTFLSEHSLSFVKNDIKKEKSALLKIISMPFLMIVKLIDILYIKFGLNNISILNQNNIIDVESHVISTSENTALLVEKKHLQTRIFELENLVKNLSEKHEENLAKKRDADLLKNLENATRLKPDVISNSTSLERQVLQQENLPEIDKKNDKFFDEKSTTLQPSFTPKNRQVKLPKKEQVFTDVIGEEDKLTQEQVRAALKDKKVKRVIRLVRSGVKPSINGIHLKYSIGKDVTRLAFNVMRNNGEMIKTSKTSYKYISIEEEPNNTEEVLITKNISEEKEIIENAEIEELNNNVVQVSFGKASSNVDKTKSDNEILTELEEG